MAFFDQAYMESSLSSSFRNARYPSGTSGNNTCPFDGILEQFPLALLCIFIEPEHVPEARLAHPDPFLAWASSSYCARSSSSEATSCSFAAWSLVGGFFLLRDVHGAIPRTGETAVTVSQYYSPYLWDDNVPVPAPQGQVEPFRWFFYPDTCGKNFFKRREGLFGNKSEDRFSDNFFRSKPYYFCGKRAHL